ncbi:MAG: hypothetical protein CMQ34_11760 [Gammaproteobacteria bacterium]|nr:hypothetical protein [Gammaproteobacteria bacterium]
MTSSSSTHAISIRDLHFAWRTGDADLLQISQWQIRAGERVFLHGPSGSGKSTLLNLICGIATPDKGSVTIAGTELGGLSGSQRDRFRARSIGVIFQQFNLIPYLSVLDNVRLAATFTGLPGGTDQRAAGLIEQLGLNSARHTKACHLSVGQQQRVAIARALLNSPPLIIADEPTSALDAAARDAFISTLLDCSAQAGSTVLVVSHDHSLATHFDNTVDLRALNRVLVSRGRVTDDVP